MDELELVCAAASTCSSLSPASFFSTAGHHRQELDFVPSEVLEQWLGIDDDCQDHEPLLDAAAWGDEPPTPDPPLPRRRGRKPGPRTRRAATSAAAAAAPVAAAAPDTDSASVHEELEVRMLAGRKAAALRLTTAARRRHAPARFMLALRSLDLPVQHACVCAVGGATVQDAVVDVPAAALRDERALRAALLHRLQQTG